MADTLLTETFAEPQPATANFAQRNLRVGTYLFRSKQAAWIWLAVRLWLGWQWLSAGWDKITGTGYNNWLTHSEGLKGFVGAANASWAHRAQTFGHPEVPYKWVLNLLNNQVEPHALLISRLVAFTELAVGIGVLAGVLTGVAAAGGLALNLIYITSGSAGPNGIFLVLSVLLIVAWRVAGYYGADHFLLPLFGPREQRGILTRGRRAKRVETE